MFLLSLLFACEGCSLGGGGGIADLQFLPENNYGFSGVLEVADDVDYMPETHLTLDWCDLTTDLRGRPFDGSVDEVLLVEFVLSKEELLDRAVRNDLFQSDAQTQFLLEPDPNACQVDTSEFEIIGNGFEPEGFTPSDEHVWMVSLSDKPDGRFDLLVSRFLTFADDATETTVLFQDGDTVLTAEVDLHSMPTIVTEEGAGPYTLDWSEVAEDASGNVFDPLLGDELLVGRYDVSSPADIEPLFLQLDSAAAELYRMSVYGETSAELAEASDEAGNPFEGFTKDGVWLVGITCTTCISPVPLLLGVVEVQ